jgi:heat shock protein HslJ
VTKMKAGEGAVTRPKLNGSEWGYAGEVGRGARFIQFRADGKISGQSGCNLFTGNYQQENGELRIGPVAITRKACLPAAMERERQFLLMLEGVRNAEVARLKLVLRDSKGQVLAELIRRDPD